MEKTGKAYAFFYCKASKEQIEETLPAIRECAQTPSDLELTLSEGFDDLGGDKELMTLAQKADYYGNNYVLEAKSASTNEAAANELADILNQAYQSPLYSDGEAFSGGIVYQDKGRYVFRE